MKTEKFDGETKLDYIVAVCTYCSDKYKRIPYVINEWGFKACKHITHTQSENGMNRWENNGYPKNGTRVKPQTNA